MIRIGVADIGAVVGPRVAPGDEDRAVGQSGLTGTENVRLWVRNVFEALAFARAFIASTVDGARVTLIVTAYAHPIDVAEAARLGIPNCS